MVLMVDVQCQTSITLSKHELSTYKFDPVCGAPRLHPILFAKKLSLVGDEKQG